MDDADGTLIDRNKIYSLKSEATHAFNIHKKVVLIINGTKHYSQDDILSKNRTTNSEPNVSYHKKQSQFQNNIILILQHIMI